MLLFYLPEIGSDHIDLNPEESKHCIKVLRLQAGDEIRLTDGKGNLYQTRITNPDPKKCTVEVINTIREYEKRKSHLHMVVAPTKNISRYEWFLEKATEIGVDEITPLICEHSERTVVKTERMERILVAAMKQSLKAYLPVINQAMKYEKFIKKKFNGDKFIAYIDESVTGQLKDQYHAGNDCTILIGPEGDFSKTEVEQARENGFIPISLGKSRLRTETAAVVACHTVNLLNC